MKMPETADDWRLIAENFNDKWNFPLCLGAIDGKHVVVKAPSNTGSLYYNYKGSFSVILLALVDANLKFICVDVGSYGRNSDGGVFAHSAIGKAMLAGNLHLPDNAALPGAENLGPLPYVMVGDEAFPLIEHLMRPFPGRGCCEEQQCFNYRLSRARRVVENAFGILATRWRVYHTKIAVKPSAVNKIVMATCVLHNMIQNETTAAQATTILQQQRGGQDQNLHNLTGIGNRASADAIRIRNAFKDYFVQSSPLSWQTNYVRRGLFAE